MGKFIHWLKRWEYALCPEWKIRHSFHRRKGYWPDLVHPRTLSEKLQWFKLHVRDPLITRCADKHAVRAYVAERIGAEHLVPLLGVWDRAEEVDFSALPGAFVLKPNHASGEVIICRDKGALDVGAARARMAAWLRTNYFDRKYEWGYKDIPPKLLCEPLLDEDIIDYRFFCIAGEVIIAKVSAEAGHTDRQGYVTAEFEPLPDAAGRRWCEGMARPPQWEAMKEMARRLSADFPFVRVDLYDVAGHIYFSELTFTPSSGMDPHLPRDLDDRLGAMYDLTPFQGEFRRSGRVTHWARQA